MFKTANKVILVDDREDDLLKLSEQLFNLRISCLPCKYDISSPLDEPFENVRLAFFDINLGGYSSSETSALKNSLANALKNYISVDNGPYALIFWTTFPDQVEGIKQFIDERYKDDIARPFIIDCIDKNLVIEDGQALKSELQNKLVNPVLNALISYENYSGDSASKVVNDLCMSIPQSDTWGNTENFTNNFDMILSKIAVMTSGFKHAQNNPTKSIIEALNPLHSYYLRNLNVDDSWKKILSQLKNASDDIELKYPEGYKAGLLNTIFHIEKDNLSEKSNRGAVIKLNINNSDFEKYFGIEYNSLFSLFIPFGGKVDEENITEFKKKSLFVLIEISASCDYSQDNERLYKYILGLKTPDLKVAKVKITQRKSNIYQLPNFILGNEEFNLHINFNYVIGKPINDNILGNKLFTLKDDLINQIGNRYANHVSRIGIISFN